MDGSYPTTAPSLRLAGNLDFNDIATGTSFGFNIVREAQGYDQTTGIGTPIASNLVPDLSRF